MPKLYDTQRMTPEQLRLAGTLLFGQSWQTDFARAVDVDPRRVRQWLSGDRPIPVGLWLEIIELLKENSRDTANYAQRLQENYDSIKDQISE